MSEERSMGSGASELKPWKIWKLRGETLVDYEMKLILPNIVGIMITHSGENLKKKQLVFHEMLSGILEWLIWQKTLRFIDRLSRFIYWILDGW